MKKVSNILARMEASLNGSLDGLELDNTDDVIEKSTVIEMINDLKMLVTEAQQQVKKLNIPVVSNCYIVRDWMVSEVFEFDNYNDAKLKYDEIYNETKNDECDIQLYQILHDFNNVG